MTIFFLYLIQAHKIGMHGNCGFLRRLCLVGNLNMQRICMGKSQMETRIRPPQKKLLKKFSKALKNM